MFYIVEYFHLNNLNQVGYEYMPTNEATEELAKIVGEMRETVQEKLESMEAEGVTCIPIADVRIMLTEHYNFMYRLIYEGR